MAHGKGRPMTMKIFGALLIVLSCGGFGFMVASRHLKEEKSLRQLIILLDYMECELQYRMTSLPILCRQVASEGNTQVHRSFLYLAQELEDQVSPDVCRCMSAALVKAKELPRYTHKAMLMLGHSLGRFDLDGQIKGLTFVRQQCNRDIDKLCENKDARLRSYQTLGLCAGAAMAILLV